MRPIELSRYSFSRLNPYAPPDRRYRIARICNANGVLPSFRRDDKATWAVWKFLQKQAASIDAKQRVRLIMSEHSISIAFRLHHGDMKHLRPLIEAYLLAALDDKSIAEKVATGEAIPPASAEGARLLKRRTLDEATRMPKNHPEIIELDKKACRGTSVFRCRPRTNGTSSTTQPSRCR